MSYYLLKLQSPKSGIHALQNLDRVPEIHACSFTFNNCSEEREWKA